VHGQFEGDTFLPELPADQWQVVESQQRAADERNPYAMTFMTLERIGDCR
jgi:dihydrofolate reductase